MPALVTGSISITMRWVGPSHAEFGWRVYLAPRAFFSEATASASQSNMLGLLYVI